MQDKKVLYLQFMSELYNCVMGPLVLQLQPGRLLLSLLVALQQLLPDLGGQLQVLLLLGQQPRDGLHVVIGPSHLGQPVSA